MLLTLIMQLTLFSLTWTR